MASDHVTLANVLVRLKDASASLREVRRLVELTHEERVQHRILCAQMDVNYCEGRILDLLADLIPTVAERDAVDEANAEAETWD
jgi:hypothetical protein